MKTRVNKAQIIILSWLLFAVISKTAYAQNFQSVVDFEKDIGYLPFEQQVDTLTMMYEEIAPHNQNTSLEYLDRAIQISKAFNYGEGLVRSLTKKGNHYINVAEDLKKAEAYLLEGVKAATKLDNDDLLPALYNRLGGVNFKYGKLDEALFYFEKGEKVAIALQSEKEIVDFAINISILHVQMGHYELAIASFRECLDLNANDRQLAMLYNNLGVTYSRYGNYDSAIFFYKKSMNYCEQDTNPRRCKVNRLHNIAVAQVHMGKNREALESFTELEGFVKDSGQQELFAQLLFNKGVAFKSLEEYDSAILVLNRSLKIAESNQLAIHLRKIHDVLASCYKGLGQYEMALSHREKYIDLKDSLFTVENNKHIEELLAKYESEKKEKEIALLKREGLQQEVLLKSKQADFEQKSLTDSLLSQRKENEILQLKGRNEVQQVLIENSQIEKQRQDGEMLLLQKEKELKTVEAKRQSQFRNAVIVGSVMLLIPALILIFVYQQKMKDKELLYAKTEEINKQKILEIIRDHELKAIKAHIEGQEKEKKRISSDLHDGIAGNLAGIKLMLSKVAEDTQQDDRLMTVVKKIDNTYKEVRAITHQLNPPGIGGASFSQLISDILQDISSGSSFSINFICHPRKKLDQLNDDIKIEVYRITQELTSNIIKHAQPHQVEVQLVMNDDYVNLLIEDNGVGFDTNKASKGIGLLSIRSRVTKLNGTIDIDSSVGRGTIVNIDIPVAKEHAV
ncbi:MAG: sensor histidine kinase [Reichenbachiella sp.]|uniref:tetratricopeptide repeat-containing sensor histidine kinase n=1 Tax=Reichenbachiella sp. TaxID=2184521 RepID=UPI003263F857